MREGRKEGKKKEARKSTAATFYYYYLLQVCEENLPLRRVGRHCSWVWTSHLGAAPAAATSGESSPDQGGRSLARSPPPAAAAPSAHTHMRGRGCSAASSSLPCAPPPAPLSARQSLRPPPFAGPASFAAAPCRTLWLSPCRKSRPRFAALRST